MNAKNIKEKRLEGDIPAEIKDQFDDFLAKHKSTKKKEVVRAMVELYMVLPENVQIAILNSQDDILQKIVSDITDGNTTTTDHCEKHKLIDRIENLETQINEINQTLHGRKK